MKHINEISNIGRAYAWIKSKYYSFIWDLKVIKNRTLRYLDDCKKIKKIWYAPIQVSYLEDACNFYASHIRDIEKQLNDKDDTIESILNDFIDYKGDAENLDERTATRSVYANHCGYIQECGDKDEEYYNFIEKCPTKFLTDSEGEDLWDIQHDRHVTYDPIAEMDLRDNARFALSQLKKRGLYEEKKY